MNGADFIAVSELLDMPKKRDCIKARRHTGQQTCPRCIVATPGETCERVNPISLDALAKQGSIIPRHLGKRFD